MKRVLVVHPRLSTFRGARVRGARQLLALLGLRLVLADDEIDVPLARYFAACVPLLAPERVEENWLVLREWIDRHPVDAVLAQTESGLLLGSLAVRHAGVRGIDVEAAHLCTNKYRSRAALFAAGVPQPSFALVDGIDAARRFAAEHGFPVVLKAVASARQRLVTLVRTPGELDGAVARLLDALPRASDPTRLRSFARACSVDLGCDPLRQFLVETFADGDPVESDGLLIGEERLAFGVVEQVHAHSPDFFIEGYLLPADRPAREIDAIEGAAAAALRALGVTDTGYSVEVRARGEDARVIEVNGRLGTDEGLADLFEVVVGRHPVRLALELALGHRPRLAPSDRRAALAYQCTYDHVRVDAVPGPAAIRALERAGLDVGIDADLGEIAREPGGGADVRPHLAHVPARDARSSRAAHERARSAVQGLAFTLTPLGATGSSAVLGAARGSSGDA